MRRRAIVNGRAPARSWCSAALAAVALMVVWARGAGAAQRLADDAAWAEDSITAAIARFFANVPPSGGVTVRGPDSNVADAAVRRCVVRALVARGVRAFVDGGGSEAPKHRETVRYRVLGMRLDYVENGGLFSGDRWQRRLRVDLSVEVEDTAGRVVRASFVRVRAAQIVPGAEFVALGRQDVIPRRVIRRHHRLVEGVAAAGTIAGFALLAF